MRHREFSIAMISRHTNYNYNRRRICHHKCCYCAAHHMCGGIENQRRLLYMHLVFIFFITKTYAQPNVNKNGKPAKRANILMWCDNLYYARHLKRDFVYNKFKNWTMFEIFIHMNINRDHQNEIEINVRSIVYKKKTLCIKTHAIFSFS